MTKCLMMKRLRQMSNYLVVLVKLWFWHLAEAYPDLKANENFKNLSKELSKVEDDIANSRKYYNGVVRIYNNNVEMFPSNIFAKLFGYKSKSMFEASANERENVKVEL